MTPRDEFKYSLMNLMFLKDSAPRDFLEGLYDQFVEDFAPKDPPKKDEKISTSEKHIESVDATTDLLPRSNDSLTRRDYFAAAALQGIFNHTLLSLDEKIKGAVRCANAIIKELDKEDERTI